MGQSDYQPPTQSAFGQFFDSLFLLALVFAALFAPLYLGLAGGGKTELAIADKTTWAGLGQNAFQQAQWEKLAMTPETAAPIIAARFDYSFDPLALALTALVVIGYFVLLFRFSKVEYRDVISERFGNQ
ncbi:MAG: hypothetical protein K2X41_08820 [Hyphomicrobium sp.]|nr:hypothetical protein [Hyphomicrobium sp.]